ncbi:MAG: hypothetical protein H0T89_29935 [Deltaproteobacteria bacterium]|nr:hypothetical protein [Deltaproteobacteria bacterium]MDQ3298550.1 hypothetical protein [Myxococcota bacterium]
MSEDDRAVMERLAALEAEVKADVDAQRSRKAAAIDKVREQRAQQQAERDELRARQAELVTRKKRPTAEVADREPERERERGDGLGGALELARRADGMRQELAKSPKAGEKSWVKSGVASMLLGPLGWLYAGSLREAVPASAAWLAFAAIASKLVPMFLLMPVLMVALPLSGIAGVVYALQYNRKGTRQRLFDRENKPTKQLRGG